MQNKKPCGNCAGWRGKSEVKLGTGLRRCDGLTVNAENRRCMPSVRYLSTSFRD